MTTIQFPFQISASGGVATCEDLSESVRSRATFLLNSITGERVMRPEWGVDVQEMFFVLEDEHTAVREAVIQALSTHIPEMTGVEVLVKPFPGMGREYLLVEVRYLIEDQMEEDVLVVQMERVV